MTLKDELELLHQRDGLLIPEKVVEYARNKKTELHHHFDWDDTSAGEKWRHEQARNLIRVEVEYNEVINKDQRVWVSLPSDRLMGGGYRKVVDVLQSPRKGELIESARAEMQAFIKRFRDIEEMAGVVREMKKVV